jgi:hypothetical protein
VLEPEERRRRLGQHRSTRYGGESQQPRQALRRCRGPFRNERMLREGRPDGAVGFPGGKGTRDMAVRCPQVRDYANDGPMTEAAISSSSAAASTIADAAATALPTSLRGFPGNLRIERLSCCTGRGMSAALSRSIFGTGFLIQLANHEGGGDPVPSSDAQSSSTASRTRRTNVELK